VIESKRMPLRTRLAAIHGDADEAAKQLDHMARGFRDEIECLLVSETPAPTRRGPRFGLGRSGLQPVPVQGVVVVAPIPTA
jgi:hypothetical protein